MKKIFLMAVTFLVAAVGHADDVHFSDNKSCVAWKTRKTLFLFKHVEPVGMNCDTKPLVTLKNGEYRFRVVIPINKFDSGEPSRDKEVFNILGGDGQPEIIFTTAAIDETKLKSMFELPTEVVGLLYVNGKGFPVHFMVTAKKIDTATEFTGHLTTTFSQLDVPKIKVALGLIANVDDYLELHFHFISSQIEHYPEDLSKAL